MLDQVELGLGRVVAQHTMVVAGITLHRVFVLLQVLWEANERERGKDRDGKEHRERERSRGKEREKEVIVDGR